MNKVKSAILVIDDDEKSLKGLSALLKNLLPDVVVNSWQPTEKDASPAEAFEKHLGNNTELVVTDYDLTTTVKGLFGLSVVGWCQHRTIPVGEFARINVDALPKEPSLFELRVPTDEEEAAKFIANTFEGFREVRTSIERNPTLISEGRSLSAVLSVLLERPHLESQFAAYMSRLGSTNSALLEILKSFANRKDKQNDDEKLKLLTYVLGHVLVNSVLKYPGPILSEEVLCAYLTTEGEAIDAVKNCFEEARYKGPFGQVGHLYWRDEVDVILDDLATTIENIDEEVFDSFGEYNRYIIESALKIDLPPHQCDRCKGRKGGFWCPFTKRPICERADCSVPASSWIPSGAQLCRVERDYYDEWAPLLGL